MDRRISTTASGFSYSQANCIHTKNVFSMLDLSHNDENYIRIKKHVDTCKTCETEFKKFALETIEVKIQIPKPQIDTETKAVFEREVSDLFRNFDLNEKALLRKKITTKIKNIDSFGVDLIKNLASKNMIKTYAFAAVLFVVLKHFF